MKEAAVFLKLITKDFFTTPNPVDVSLDTRLDHAINWLIYAHDLGKDNGVSYGYSVKGGWRPSYVETTGYIITTFYNLSALYSRPDLADRAASMGHWLQSVQLKDGSFTNTRFSNQSGIVFDTGQDLFGLIRCYKETQNQSFAESANKAADWLVKVADEKGRWTNCTHMGIPHVYNTRVAWALLQANVLWPSTNREEVAKSNLDFALEQENDGWFDQCAFTVDAAPFTHTIAYAIRGIWESSEILDNALYRDAALRAASAVAKNVREDGFLAGQFDKHGNEQARYVCLTGNCQMAIIWAKMFRKTNNSLFRDAAVRALNYVMKTQDITSTNPGINGAIKGSHPIWGRYSPLAYPNWATKFYIDALIESSEWLK